MSLKKCIITGITGCVGIAVATNLLKNGYRVFGIVRPNSTHLYRLDELNDTFKNTLEIIALDMEHIEVLSSKIEGNILYFFHCAWDGTRDASRMDEERQKKNYDMTRKAARVAVKLHCTVFAGVGSQAEYGSVHEDIVQSETYDARPDTAYGKYKLLAAHAVCEICHEQGMRFVWGRIFSTYGPWDYSHSILESCLTHIPQNEPTDLSLCTQLWNFIHVADVAEGFRRLAEHPDADGIFNLASHDTRVLKEFILEIAEVFHSTSDLRFGGFPYGPNGPVYLHPDITKLSTTLQWEPQIPFREGILSRYEEKKKHLYET